MEKGKDGSPTDRSVSSITSAGREALQRLRERAYEQSDTLGTRICGDCFNRYHPMVAVVADAIENSEGDEVMRAQAVLRHLAAVMPSQKAINAVLLADAGFHANETFSSKWTQAVWLSLLTLEDGEILAERYAARSASEDTQAEQSEGEQ